MIKYRICENKFGWFKVQKLEKAWEIFGFTIRKSRWKDVKSYYYGSPGTVNIYETRKGAERKIERYVSYDEQDNNDWKCGE